jgi:hypothetical protein
MDAVESLGENLADHQTISPGRTVVMTISDIIASEMDNRIIDRSGPCG